MLRLLFVLIIVVVGIFFSVQGPFYALLFYLWNAYFRPEHWVWFDPISQFKISLIVGSFLLIATLPVVGRFRLNWRVALLLLFLAQSVVSLLASEHVDWSTPFWVDFLKVVIITLLITFLVSDLKRYRLTLLVIAYSLGLETAKQGWAQLILNPGATNANPNPFLGDNNGVALGVLMLVPIFVSLAQTATGRWERYLHRFFIVGLVYRAISTYSRGGFVAAGVLAAITLWRSPRKVRTLIVMVALAGAVLSVMPDDFWQRMNTITVPAEQRDVSSEGRLHFWEVATRMVAAKPLTGVGFSGYRASFGTYETSAEWGEDRQTHSAWFGTMAEMGYPGLVLFVAIILGALLSCAQVNKRAKASGMKDVGIYATNMRSTLLVYIAGATFLSFQYNEMYWHMIGLTIALERIQREAVSASGVAPNPEPPTPMRTARQTAFSR